MRQTILHNSLTGQHCHLFDGNGFYAQHPLHQPHTEIVRRLPDRASYRRIFGRFETVSFHYQEVQSAEDIVGAINATQPVAILYNYYVSTLPMVVPQFTHFVRGHGIRQIGIIHDPMDMDFVRYVETVFDEWIVHDETNPISSSRKFTACRPIPRTAPTPPPTRFSVGSHGFGISPWKAFDWIVEAVQREYDEADINLNIGAAAFGDEQGKVVKHWQAVCAAKVTKPGIRLNITSRFFAEESELIQFLQGNSLNVYFVAIPPTSPVRPEARTWL